MTPQNGWIGRQVPPGSTSAGVHGPAATTIAPAGRTAPSTTTPVAARPSRATLASAPSTSVAPRARASAAKAWVAAAGATGKPIAMRTADRPGARAGSRRRERGAVDELGGDVRVRRREPAGDRPHDVCVPADREDPGRFRREAERPLGRRGRQRGGERVRERAIRRERLAIQRGEGRVGRVPHDARVASRGAGRDRRALVQGHGRAATGELGGERRPDDAAAEDRDVRRGHGRQPARPAVIVRSSSTSRSTSASVL